MKGTLTFKLPEEACEFSIASNAMDWALTVWDIADYLRNALKYNSLNLDIKTLEVIQTKLFEILEYRNLTLDIIT